MKLFLYLLISMIAISSCSEIYFKIMDSVKDLPKKDQFKVWHHLNKKTYSLDSEEGIMRYKNFKKAISFINKRNSEITGYTLGLTGLSDLSQEELDQLTAPNKQIVDAIENERKVSIEQGKNKVQSGFLTFDEQADLIDQEDSIKRRNLSQVNDKSTDWTYLYTRAPRNQKSCGSCWAFSTSGVLEAYNVKENGNADEFLSPQQLVDCSKGFGTKGCNGGWPGKALEYVINRGLSKDSNYSYKAVDQTCNATAETTPHIKITDYLDCQWYNDSYGFICWAKGQKYVGKKYSSTFDVISKAGPYSAIVNVSNDFYYYKSGDMGYACPTLDKPHAIVAVAYTETGIKFRNSWDTNWGVGGYGFIKRNMNNYFSCYMEKYATFPVGVVKP